MIKGIEVGHIFKLGYKYTDALRPRPCSGPDGKPVRPIMGCYGIGVERAMAACVEVHHDEKGIVWPAAVAPFEAVVIVAQQNDAAVAEAGERVYRALLDAGVDVIIDDRPDRAGREVQRRGARRHPVPRHDRQARPGRRAPPSSPTARPARRSPSRSTRSPSTSAKAVAQALAATAA